LVQQQRKTIQTATTFCIGFSEDQSIAIWNFLKNNYALCLTNPLPEMQ
jgi:hypothetical protein